MKITIKNPAPLNRNQRKWGDYHFGASLQNALEARGANVVQHYWPQWDADAGEDVVLVLRGWHNYAPPPDKVSILWIISHPSLVTKEELDAYTIVYSASSTFRSLVRGVTDTPVQLLRQCTDTTLFYPPDRTSGEGACHRLGIVFVASSRGARRDMVHWALRAGTDLTVVGRNWEREGLEPLNIRHYVPNEQVAEIYRSARLSLNDHWMDMRRFGIVSNRIFDCLACGVPVLSDSFPELRDLFGDSMLFANNASEYAQAMKEYEQNYERLLENARRAGEIVREEYSFAACAEQIMVQALSPPVRSEQHRVSQACLIEDNALLEAALKDSVIQDEQKIEDLKEDITALTRGIAEAKIEYKDLERQYRELERVFELRLRDEQERLTRQVKTLESRITSLMSSRSWKMTVPFRKIAKIGKGLMSRLRESNG